MGSKPVYRKCGQLFTQQVGAAVKLQQVCVLGGEGAEEQQQVGKKKFWASTVRVQTDRERSTLTSRPHTP